MCVQHRFSTPPPCFGSLVSERLSIQASANVYQWMLYAHVVTFTALTLWLKIAASQSSFSSVIVLDVFGHFLRGIHQVVCRLECSVVQFHLDDTRARCFRVARHGRCLHSQVALYRHSKCLAGVPTFSSYLVQSFELLGRDTWSTYYPTHNFEMTGGYIRVAGWFALYTLSMFWMIRHLGPIAIAFSMLILSTRYSIQAVRPPITNEIIAGMFLWLATLLWVAV